MNELVIRADASRSVGTGHVMRSLAFAEAAADRGVPVRFVVGGDSTATGLVANRGFGAVFVADPHDHRWVDDATDRSVVLVDGLHFDDELFASVAGSRAHLAVMEDIPAIRYADVVISPETTGGLVHEHAAGALVLAGITYAPIRREFRRRRRLRRRIGPDGSLLITLGGSDAAGLTGRLATAVTPPRTYGFARCTIITGPLTPRLDGFDGSPSVTVRHDVDDMSLLYDDADVAVSAAGTGAWELMCMGVPSVFVEVSDNQAFMSVAINGAGAGVGIGTWDGDDRTVRAALGSLRDDRTYRAVSESALAYIDGLGAERVVDGLRAAF